MFGQHFTDGLGLVHGAHERHHDPDVLETHLFAHMAQSLAFQRKAGLEVLRDIPGGSSIAQHGVFLVRFMAGTTDEVGIFIGFEVR